MKQMKRIILLLLLAAFTVAGAVTSFAGLYKGKSYTVRNFFSLHEVGVDPSWILVKVEMPYAYASITEDKAMAKMELAEYDLCSGWTQLGDEEVTVEPTDNGDGTYTIGKKVRYYYYNSVLEGHQRTGSPIFKNFKIPDFTKIPEGYRTSIDITAYNIQSEGRATALDGATEILNGLHGQ